jgi:hypothetical protein
VDMEELRIVCRHGVVYLDGSLPSEEEHSILLQLVTDVVRLETIVDRLRDREGSACHFAIGSMPLRGGKFGSTGALLRCGAVFRRFLAGLRCRGGGYPAAKQSSSGATLLRDPLRAITGLARAVSADSG